MINFIISEEEKSESFDRSVPEIKMKTSDIDKNVVQSEMSMDDRRPRDLMKSSFLSRWLEWK